MRYAIRHERANRVVLLLGHEGELVRVSAFGWQRKRMGGGGGAVSGELPGKGKGKASGAKNVGNGGVASLWEPACMRSLNHDTRSSIEFRLRRDKLVILTVAEVVTSRPIATSNHNCLYEGRWRLC
jgi:hypothetical protein